MKLRTVCGRGKAEDWLQDTNTVDFTLWVADFAKSYIDPSVGGANVSLSFDRDLKVRIFYSY